MDVSGRDDFISIPVEILDRNIVQILSTFLLRLETNTTSIGYMFTRKNDKSSGGYFLKKTRECAALTPKKVDLSFF
jgi:hypothetical protein